jgi:hypothetical protein
MMQLATVIAFSFFRPREKKVYAPKVSQNQIEDWTYQEWRTDAIGFRSSTSSPHRQTPSMIQTTSRRLRRSRTDSWRG